MLVILPVVPQVDGVEAVVSALERLVHYPPGRLRRHRELWTNGQRLPWDYHSTDQFLVFQKKKE